MAKKKEVKLEEEVSETLEVSQEVPKCDKCHMVLGGSFVEKAGRKYCSLLCSNS